MNKILAVAFVGVVVLCGAMFASFETYAKSPLIPDGYVEVSKRCVPAIKPTPIEAYEMKKRLAKQGFATGQIVIVQEEIEEDSIRVIVHNKANNQYYDNVMTTDKDCFIAYSQGKGT